MAKEKKDNQNTTQTKSESTSPKKENPQIDLSSYCSLKGLKFTVRARLEHQIKIQDIKSENTVEEWDKIRRKI